VPLDAIGLADLDLTSRLRLPDCAAGVPHGRTPTMATVVHITVFSCSIIRLVVAVSLPHQITAWPTLVG
jgi:hypothetical protein